MNQSGHDELIEESKDEVIPDFIKIKHKAGRKKIKGNHFYFNGGSNQSSDNFDMNRKHGNSFLSRNFAMSKNLNSL